MTRLRDTLGEAKVAELRTAFEQLLDSEGPGFAMIFNHVSNQFTDVYTGVCQNCTDIVIHHAMAHAVHAGTLPEKGVAMLWGHKHDPSLPDLHLRDFPPLNPFN